MKRKAVTGFMQGWKKNNNRHRCLRWEKISWTNAVPCISKGQTTFWVQARVSNAVTQHKENIRLGERLYCVLFTQVHSPHFLFKAGGDVCVHYACMHSHYAFACIHIGICIHRYIHYAICASAMRLCIAASLMRLRWLFHGTAGESRLFNLWQHKPEILRGPTRSNTPPHHEQPSFYSGITVRIPRAYW